jgi:hypothetical protein
MGYLENRESLTGGVAQRCAHWSQVSPSMSILDDCLLFRLSVGAQPTVTVLGCVQPLKEDRSMLLCLVKACFGFGREVCCDALAGHDRVT